MKPANSTRLRVAPIELADARDFIARIHRHHKPPVGHRFSLSALDPSGAVVGVAVVGRPVSRMFDKLERVEVTRLATDGTPNACSILYAAAARAAKAMGYLLIQTYILASESGGSLRAAGWECINPLCGSAGKQWESERALPFAIAAATSGQLLLPLTETRAVIPRDRPSHASEAKQLWGKRLDC